ncbi:MAG: hypothetical protein JSR55_13275 [Proteobacteria bacterium]|nr:hypothetical protein [Pseudomonadota bacterium]
MKVGFFAVSIIAVAGLCATAAQAYDVTALRNTPASDAPGTLQAEGFRFTGTYNDFDNDWKMWFNRRTGECVGYTQKGREVKRAKDFGNDRCRDADRGGFGGRYDHDNRYGPTPPGYGDRDRYDDRDRHGDHDGYADHGHWGGNDVPGWAVGTFRGYSYGTEVSLEVSPDGRAVFTANGQRTYGRFSDGRLQIGPTEFYVERDGDGMTARQVDNRNIIIKYRRR